MHTLRQLQICWGKVFLLKFEMCLCETYLSAHLHIDGCCLVSHCVAAMIYC